MPGTVTVTETGPVPGTTPSTRSSRENESPARGMPITPTRRPVTRRTASYGPPSSPESKANVATRACGSSSRVVLPAAPARELSPRCVPCEAPCVSVASTRAAAIDRDAPPPDCFRRGCFAAAEPARRRLTDPSVAGSSYRPSARRCDRCPRTGAIGMRREEWQRIGHGFLGVPGAASMTTTGA